MKKVAKQWGYDTRAEDYFILLSDEAPDAEYTLRASRADDPESNNGPEFLRTCKAKAGDTVRVSISADHGDGVRCTLEVDGEQVDSTWCRVTGHVCPHCGGEL